MKILDPRAGEPPRTAELLEPTRPAPLAAQAERRRAPRLKLALCVQLRFPSVDAVFDCESVDISRTGVFLRGTELRPVGTPIRMSIRVRDRELVLHGTVVRVLQSPHGDGLGIAFNGSVIDESGLFDELLCAPDERR